MSTALFYTNAIPYIVLCYTAEQYALPGHASRRRRVIGRGSVVGRGEIKANPINEWTRPASRCVWYGMVWYSILPDCIIFMLIIRLQFFDNLGICE